MIDSGQPFWAACLEEKALADKTNEILKQVNDYIEKEKKDLL